ncbi:MAG TPA: hypothetical protein VG650_10910 [Mycobacteriales bacterium]|nr:hypothetical protein [Mycobacteriales bacterium]
MKRLWFLALSAAIGGLAVPALTPTAAAGPATTAVVMTSPVGPHGQLQPGYRVVKHYTGAKCTPHSAVTGNAYKCVAHFGYDPCWLSGKHAYVDCISSPYSRQVTRLHVTRGYHNKGGVGRAASLPWGLQLANGVKTTRIPGNFGTVQGQRINYSYDQFKVVLVGKPDKTGSLWRIRKARETGGFHYKIVGWVTITKAWFGAPTRLG